MPHHFHALLWQSDEQDVSKLMMNFKKASSAFIRREFENSQNHSDWIDRFREHGSKIRPDRPRIQIWMDRYDDVVVQTGEAIRTKLNYIQGNPVRDELVSTIEEYPYSSARDFYDNPNPWITVETDFLGLDS
jgi:REP element-mobilizing transposase RayT